MKTKIISKLKYILLCTRKIKLLVVAGCGVITMGYTCPIFGVFGMLAGMLLSFTLYIWTCEREQ